MPLPSVSRLLRTAALNRLPRPPAAVEGQAPHPRQDTEAGEGQTERRGGMGGLGQALRLTLSQLGLLPGDGERSITAAAASIRPRTLRADLHRLMHALFDALRGLSPDGRLSLIDTGGAIGTLAGLAGEGEVPAPLRQAFAALMQDLRAGGLPDVPQPTLQQFLLALQQNLRGTTGSARAFSAAGNFLALRA